MMNHPRALLILLLSLSVGISARAADFVPLFNGRNLDGWVNVNCSPDTWTATNGVLYCTGAPIGELRTTRMYQNFIVELEWRHLRPKGNAGVFVWADALTARGQPFIRGIEVQVLDGQEGDWFTSDGDIFPIHGARMTPLNGRGGDRAFPTQKRVKPSPEWNHYRIECVDGAITLAVNGAVVTRGTNSSPRKGYLCLESEGSPVEFRNLRLQELPASVALEPQHIATPDEGFRPLYNGRDLTGWQQTPDVQRHWKAADWILEHDGGRGDTEPHLWTDEEFGDFVLVADWRWVAKPSDADLPVLGSDGAVARHPDGTPRTQRVPHAGDSGIYLRGNDRSQVNIWCWPAGSGEVYGYREDPSLPSEIRAALAPRLKADRPIGEWNRFVITLRGDRLSVVLNDQLVVDHARLPGIPPRGRLALQHHGAPIQFANLFVKRLD